MLGRSTVSATNLSFILKPIGCRFYFSRQLTYYSNCSPLGPFVPAPPEVAMQMIRDQGGPPFEGGGRHGRPGPQISGPGPILLSPAFRQDPRRIRRYSLGHLWPTSWFLFTAVFYAYIIYLNLTVGIMAEIVINI